MSFFFSCDWGTSAFRLRLVDAVKGTVLSEIKTDHGIAPAFSSWKQTNQDEIARVAFYQTYLLNQVEKIKAELDVPGAPIILSGMASSSIGMMELPYKELPFQSDGTDLTIHVIEEQEGIDHKIIMISGVRSARDVVRGEETMLIGCNAVTDDTEQLFIFPGTHSKHITVKNGFAQKILTYMTGELFELLSKKSILSASVKKNDPQEIFQDQPFIDGVLEGASSNILNSIFHVRTNQLFRKKTLAENYDYLSGLLIGHELKDIAGKKSVAIRLVCSELLKEPYLKALGALGLNTDLEFKNASEALIHGQRKIMQQFGFYRDNDLI